ncbi:MAG: DEAD/DEAH box helicase [Planctomycetota bacterium]|nr:DEAD/DEAH box helicase [Planctomycetota bacterium]
MHFDNLGLIEPLLRAIREEGYTEPTPIQVKAIPPLLEGHDLLGCAQTGTGKTAAFSLPILQRLTASAGTGEARRIRALVITPTRELAAQIDESFAAYGRHVPLRHTVVFGGVRQGPQVKDLKAGVDILVATPGRLMDLMQQRYIHLEHVEVFVLDEGDRMLDMGFIDDIRRIVRHLPRERQTMLFSATISSTIQKLADQFCHEPVMVRVTPEAPAALTVDQKLYLVERSHKRTLLVHLLADPAITRALVFTRTKDGADRVGMHLLHEDIACRVIHADKPQAHRESTIKAFKAGKVRVLVASDLAARGLDIDDISHVFNFDMPQEAEVYIHRIGRTGRAGASGKAISFCDMEERARLDDIEKLLGTEIPIVVEHPFVSPLPHRAKSAPVEPKVQHSLYRGRRPTGRRR